MKKFGHLKVMVPSIILLVVLICSIAVPITAKGNSDSSANAAASSQLSFVKGEVTDIDEDDLTLEVQTRNGETVTVATAEDTKFYQVSTVYRMTATGEVNPGVNQGNNLHNQSPNTSGQSGWGNRPGQVAADNTDIEENAEYENGLMMNERVSHGWMGKIKSLFGKSHQYGEAAVFEDIEVGDKVVVRLNTEEDLAKQVLIIKASDIQTVRGDISDVDDDEITITNDDEDYTLTLNEDTRVILKGAWQITEGQYAIATYEEDEDENLAILVRVFPEDPAIDESSNTELNSETY